MIVRVHWLVYYELMLNLVKLYGMTLGQKI